MPSEDPTTLGGARKTNTLDSVDWLPPSSLKATFSLAFHCGLQY